MSEMTLMPLMTREEKTTSTAATLAVPALERVELPAGVGATFALHPVMATHITPLKEYDQDRREELSLQDAVSNLLEECRTIVPGMQALFGFQLIAVFNTTFREQLAELEQQLHLAAIILVVLAIALVMTPPVLHRQTEPSGVSQRFLDVSNRLVTWSMAPLVLGITIDVYIVARLCIDSTRWGAVVAGVMFGVFFVLWFILPRSRRLQTFCRGAPPAHRGGQ
jgi:hypothetical protein